MFIEPISNLSDGQRFWHHVLYDLGFVSTKEPFKRLFNQGMILGHDGAKMSKSRGNVVNPDDTVDAYGADAMRLYEMFMGPLDKAKPWNSTGLQGCSRFIKKIWALLITNEGELSREITDDKPTKETLRYLHNMIKRVSHNIENLQFNTCVSEFMIFTNHIHGLETINIDIIKTFIVLINPFMPHLAQELWELSGNKSELTFNDWPNYDENQILSDKLKLAVQINGKRRSEIEVDVNMEEKDIKQFAKSDSKIIRYLEEKVILKEIYVRGRLVNLVVK